MKDSIEVANAALSLVKIRSKGNRLYLRATLPAKDGSATRKQYEISTGLPNTPDGLRTAKARAQRLESDLNLERFKWEDWADLPPAGGIFVKDAIERFEKWYWETRGKTIGREKMFKYNYLGYLKHLPEKAVLSPEIIRETLVTHYEADSYGRQRAHLVMGMLAKCHKIPLPDDWKYLKGKYKPKTDWYIPTDEEIEAIHEGIKNPAWKWVFGLIATYGIRPHEFFHLDLSQLPRLKIKENTKTGEHIAYPIRKRWLEDFDLANPIYPKFQVSSETNCNQDLGQKISLWFWRQELPLTAMSLRHAYAIRCARVGVDSLVASEWMGHDIGVHRKHYWRFINEITMDSIWKRLDLD